MSETELEKYERLKRAAERAHDDGMRMSSDSLQATVQFGLEAIRTAALVNGGAVVALFAFAGTMYAADKKLALDLLRGPLPWVVGGVILAGLASGAAYLAQYLYTQAHGGAERRWEPPFLDYTVRWVPVKIRVGATFQLIAMAFVVGSYCALSWGGYRALSILPVE